MRDIDAVLDVTEEVADARRDGRGIVALESTIIAHGMPHPQNLETARLLERTVRETGATPATIALIDGRIKIGLADYDLSRLADGDNVIKASRRDLGVAVARRMTAATTVAGTMICAHLGGIRVFATGGIGGVHRGGETSWDVSADLQELARTPVAVVSAGAKAILDLRRTLEYLETMGVPVIGYRTDSFPAFYTPDSGHPVDYRIDQAAEIAAALAAGWGLGLEGGAVIANPVPEAHASPAEDIARAIDSALEDAERRDISGKALTPFLLSRIGELTEGESLRTNIALAKNNATLAGEIAAALADG
jgi:pseudouridine-5'-phosphate glycosidase